MVAKLELFAAQVAHAHATIIAVALASEKDGKFVRVPHCGRAFALRCRQPKAARSARARPHATLAMRAVQ